MPSTIRFLDNILDKLKLLENVSYTEVNGNYLLFQNKCEFGAIYDDHFVIYITKRAKELIPYAKEYEIERYGKKKMCLHVTEVGNRIVLKELVTFIVKDIMEEKEKATLYDSMKKGE